MTVRGVLVAQFIVVVAVLFAAEPLLGMFVGGTHDLALGLFGFPLLLLSAIAAVGAACSRPTRRRALVVAATFALAIGCAMNASRLGILGERLFFNSRRSGLEAFLRDARQYGRIREMSDGERYWVSLNGELVAYTPDRVVTPPVNGERAVLPVETVLQRDGIDRATYDAYRHRLQKLSFISVEIEPGFAAFVFDGILDNLYGFLHVEPGGAPPPLRSYLFDSELVQLIPLGNGWYRFATT